MTYLDQELIALTGASDFSGEAVGFTREKIDRVGSTRTSVARLQARVGGFRYSFTAGGPTATEGIDVAANEVVEIYGYENLRNFRAKTGVSTSSIYVIYGV